MFAHRGSGLAAQKRTNRWRNLQPSGIVEATSGNGEAAKVGGRAHMRGLRTMCQTQYIYGTNHETLW